jgi:hypothetical protein
MVQKILKLRVGCTDIKAQHDAMRANLLKSTPDTHHHSQLLLSLDMLKAEVKMADHNLGCHEAMLGRVGGIAFDMLKKMKVNHFFEMWMNVCALKQWLQDKLHECRFEEGRLHVDDFPFVTGKYYV